MKAYQYVKHMVNDRNKERTVCGHSIKLKRYYNIINISKDVTCSGCINNMKNIKNNEKKRNKI